MSVTKKIIKKYLGLLGHRGILVDLGNIRLKNLGYQVFQECPGSRVNRVVRGNIHQRSVDRRVHLGLLDLQVHLYDKDMSTLKMELVLK